MKLKNACLIAKDCNLETVGEAVHNIELHAISIFAYDSIDKELKELNEDFDHYFLIARVNISTSISDFLIIVEELEKRKSNNAIERN